MQPYTNPSDLYNKVMMPSGLSDNLKKKMKPVTIFFDEILDYAGA